MVSLAIDPPPSSQRDRPTGRAGRAFLVLALAGALAGAFWLGRVTAPGRATAPSEGASTPTATAGPPSPPASAGGEGRGEGGRAASTATSTATAAPTATPTTTTLAGQRRLVATVSGSLEDSIASAMPREERPLAEQLTQVVNRLLVWHLLVARDGRKGDRIEVLWAPPAAVPGLPAAGEPVVEAVRYASSKLGSVVTAYRWQPDGARWPRYYREDGSELELRLVDAPIGDYEQVTSLLRDGRRHKGVDFKAPVGSPVFAPFDGVVERRNWNFSGNGNCLELRDPATGRRAIFLHLDVVPREMAPGRRVKKGEAIAASGNSGRSFAPHLHYQLEDGGGRVLDPFGVHRTERRALSPAQKALFEAVRAAMDARLAG